MYSFYCRMYCCSSFLVFFKHTFSLEQEPEPAKKKPGAGQKWTGSATLQSTLHNTVVKKFKKKTGAVPM